MHGAGGAVWTVTSVSVAPAVIVAVVGGVTTLSGPAVPPGVRLTVTSEVDVVEALMMKSAGWPAVTWSATD